MIKLLLTGFMVYVLVRLIRSETKIDAPKESVVIPKHSNKNTDEGEYVDYEEIE